MNRGRWEYTSAEEWPRVPGAMVWRRTFTGTKDQVSQARAFVKGLFTGTGRAADAAQIIGELCNNALVHTRSGQEHGWFGVEIVLDDLAYLAVTDLGGGGRPVLNRTPFTDDLQEGGFGIALVEELALTIGVHGSPELGHTIWADLDLTMKSNQIAEAAVALAS